MENNNQKVIRISRKKLIITLIILVVLGLVFGIILNSLSTARMKSASSPEIGMLSPDYYKDYFNQSSDITDTREFLKTSYSATLKTRDVPGVIKDVKNAIRDVAGRMDNINSSEKYGRISFVVPKSRFEEFRSEIESLTYTKLYTENISSQNLLSQKQNIEERTTNILSTLESLKKQKDDLALKHTQAVNTINRDITRIRVELANVRSNIANITEEIEPSVITSLRNQESSLVGQEVIQRQKLSGENNNYAVQNQNLDRLISNENNNLTNINQQDSQFANNIETVNGSVSVYWISVWGLIKEYSPINPWILIILILILGRYWLVRKGYLSRIELV
ncbi:MAG: DUF4349 domain-containing protein [Candidatus Vogelbacteria bacterium]